jgi:hypothetical protein
MGGGSPSMREVSPPGRYLGWLARGTTANFAIAR